MANFCIVFLVDYLCFLPIKHKINSLIEKGNKVNHFDKSTQYQNHNDTLSQQLLFNVEISKLIWTTNKDNENNSV